MEKYHCTEGEENLANRPRMVVACGLPSKVKTQTAQKCLWLAECGLPGKVKTYRTTRQPTNVCGLCITKQSKYYRTTRQPTNVCGLWINQQSKKLSTHITAHKCLWIVDYLAKEKTITPQDSPQMFVACGLPSKVKNYRPTRQPTNVCGLRITQQVNLSYHQTAHKCLWLADHLAKPNTIVPQHSTQMFVACGLRITQLSKIIQDHQTAHKCLWIVDYLEKQNTILPPDSLQCLWHHWLVDHSKVKACRTTRQPTRVCGLRIT